jgi:hypothetical protein
MWWGTRFTSRYGLGRYIMSTVLDEWKVWPRVMMLVFTLMSWRVVEWFMNLPDPSVQQAGLVSVVMGAATGAFGIWMSKEVK